MSTIIPSWVEPDPAREIAIDALGLSWQADQLADELLPDLSVVTRRARYLSFLSWAVSKTAGATNPERRIHRLEAQLALYEARLHDRDPKACKGIVGRESAHRYIVQNRGVLPTRPEALYRNTAFRAYRPLLRAIDLLDGMKVTPKGRKVAAAFGSAARGPRTCLSKISGGESRLLRRALGFDLHIKTTTQNEEDRRATFIELKKRFGGAELSPQTVLPAYASKPGTGKHAVRLILHRAYVWEVLALGLNLAFFCMLQDMEIAQFASRLQAARRGRPSLPPLYADFSAANEDAPRHVVALLRHACSLRPSAIGLQKSAEDLAWCLFDHSPKFFLNALLTRHASVKGGEAWVRCSGNRGRLQRLSPLRKGLPDGATLHPYRLAAFYELGKDLNLWP